MFLIIINLVMVIVSSAEGTAQTYTKRMTGVHLKVAVYHEPPIFYIKRDPNNASAVQYSGVPKDLFDLLAASLNFTYSFVEVTPNMVKEKGSIDSAMISQLLEENADINWRFNSPTAELLAVVDFTASITVLRFSLLQPMPTIQTRYLAPIKPFQPMVWFMILAAFVATVIALTLASKIKQSSGRNQTQTNIWVSSNNAMFAFMVLMSQGTYLRSNKLSLRFVAGAWCLIAIVIVYAYNGTLISYIYLPKYEPVVNTWEELAASKTLRVAAPRGGLFAQLMLNATSGVMKTLGDSLRRHPGDHFLSLPGELDKIMKSGCCAYIDITKLHQVLLTRSMMANNGECKMTIGKDLDYSQVWCFTVVKNLPYLPIINHEIQRIRQNGILHRQGLTYYNKIDKCMNRKVDRSKNSKLTLYDLASAFFVLALGCSLSLLAFLVELILGTRPTWLQRRPNRPIIL